MKWAFAEPSIIARSLEKDSFYVEQLDTKLRDLFGTHRLYRWFRAPSLPYSAILYHLLTIGANQQTLGEEYCQLLPVDTASRTSPSRWKRLALVLIPIVLGSSAWRECFERLHRALFYLEGKYAEPLRRLLALRYVYYPRRVPTARRVDVLYLVLGVTGLAVGGWQAYQLLQPYLSGERSIFPKSLKLDKDEPSLDGEGRGECPLCLEQRRETTIAPCGHLFCWGCLMEWLKERSECPLCRTSCKPAQLFCILDPYAVSW